LARWVINSYMIDFGLRWMVYFFNRPFTRHNKTVAFES
jgi:hypothetical protein